MVNLKKLISCGLTILILNFKSETLSNKIWKKKSLIILYNFMILNSHTDQWWKAIQYSEVKTQK